MLEAIIGELVGKYPILVSVLSVIGLARVVFKPLVSVARAFVSATDSKADDQMLDKVEASAFYKGILYVLDWTLSIKPIKK